MMVVIVPSIIYSLAFLNPVSDLCADIKAPMYAAQYLLDLDYSRNHWHFHISPYIMVFCIQNISFVAIKHKNFK